MYELALYVSLLNFAGITAWYARQRFASVFHPITLYLLFHGLVFAVRPLFAFYGHYDFLYPLYEFSPSAATKLTVIIAANMGLLAFVATAARYGDAVLRFKQGPLDLVERGLMIKPFVLMLVVLAPVGIASLQSLVFKGFGGMMRDRATGIAINTTSNGWFVDAQLVLVPCVMLSAWMFRFRWWSLLPLAMFVFGRSATGSRGPFVVACVGVALAYLYDRRERFPTWRTALGALLLLVVFVQVGNDRGRSVRVMVGRDEAPQVITSSQFMERMDFANLEFFEYLVNTVPAKTGTYGYFVDNLQLFTEPIPRKMWKDKPIGPPIKMYELFDYGYPIGMTQSLPGYGWAQLGFIGVIAWCALWGLALGKLYNGFAHGRQGTLAVALWLCFLPVFVVAYRDGTVLSVVRTSVFYLAPVLLTGLFAWVLGVPSAARLEAAARRARPVPADPVERPLRANRTAPAQAIVPRSRRPRGSAPMR